jgi:hypothetical protein
MVLLREMREGRDLFVEDGLHGGGTFAASVQAVQPALTWSSGMASAAR